jgi:GNAT superfamily N-acetyltransferase
MPKTSAPTLQELADFVDIDFARRLEMAEMIFPDCVDAIRNFTPGDPAEAEHVAGGIAFFGGVTYPANQMVGMGLYGEVSDADVDRVEAFFRSRGVPSTIVLSPLAHESLCARLGERGYGIAEFNSVLIRRIRPEEPFMVPPGMTIEAVTSATLKPWMNALAEGFAQDIVVLEGVFGGFAALPGALPFLARIGGEVAGGCGGRIIPEARIAALFGTATLPAFRRRGVQTGLIAQRLHEAARAGCEYAVVSTHPGSGSQRNMERRGFRLAYTKAVMTREWPELASSKEANHGH